MVHSASSPKPESRWYRVPIVWMVIGIPLFSVVFTLSIVWISVKTFDGVVEDDYYRKGLEINRDLARDRYANSINLQAFGKIIGDKLNVQFESDVGEVWPDRLQLGFYHPTVANRDVILDLRHTSSGQYSASLSALGHGKWNVITGTDAWRLEGTLFHPAAMGFDLRPVQSVHVSQ